MCAPLAVVLFNTRITFAQGYKGNAANAAYMSDIAKGAPAMTKLKTVLAKHNFFAPCALALVFRDC